MSNEVVKYHNDLNTVVMRTWTPEEMDFFFSVITKVREKGCRLITFHSDDLKKLSRFANEHKKRWIDTMESVARKSLDLKYMERSKNRLSIMNLFAYFNIDGDKKTVEVEVSSKFEYVVNKLEAHFTQYELAEFTSIRSTYAKTAYRLLKQWRTVGYKKFTLDDFKTVMAMPISYKSSEIDRAVIKPIITQLSPFFEDLKVKKIKSTKRGNPVLGYEFTWKAEKTESYDPQKYQKKAKTKTKQASNVPSWSQPNYKNSMTEQEKDEIELKKRELLEKMNKLQTQLEAYKD